MKSISAYQKNIEDRYIHGLEDGNVIGINCLDEVANQGSRFPNDKPYSMGFDTGIACGRYDPECDQLIDDDLKTLEDLRSSREEASRTDDLERA